MTKANVHEGRSTLSFSINSVVIFVFYQKKTNTHLLLSIFQQSQVAPDARHNSIISTSTEVRVVTVDFTVYFLQKLLHIYQPEVLILFPLEIGILFLFHGIVCQV